MERHIKMDKCCKILLIVILMLQLFAITANAKQFTVLNMDDYRYSVLMARSQIRHILSLLHNTSVQNKDEKIAFLAHHFFDIPYAYDDAMGEGDWQADSLNYKPGDVHIIQDPVYRVDRMDCQTFVQVMMALYHATELRQFEKNLIHVAYGAAGNPSNEFVRYYNRNNFIDGDFNPVNQKNGWLKDVTAVGPLSAYAEKTKVILSRLNWFFQQQQHMPDYVRVLREDDGSKMVERFIDVYPRLYFPNFASERITIAYLPKNTLALKQSNGDYKENEKIFKQIPTPAIVEIVRDAKKWNINGKNIKELIGTETSISHLGIAYRKIFKQGELIYNKITCSYQDSQRQCDVKPIYCKEKSCPELMFLQATDSYPPSFYLYHNDQHLLCSAEPPAHNKRITMCNRVIELPLFDYLTDYQYGWYRIMQDNSILGLHIEKMT